MEIKAKFNRTNCPPKEVKESVIESLGAQKREKEDSVSGIGLKKKVKAIESAFKEFGPTWPTWVNDSEPAARKAWQGLNDDERDQAVARSGDYLKASKTGGRTQTCALAKYLSEKRWSKLDAPEPDTDHPMILKPYGKGYMAHRFMLLDRERRVWVKTAFQQLLVAQGKGATLIKERHRGEFPLVAKMDDDAGLGRTGCLPPGTRQPDTSDYISIQQGSPEWEAWEAWHKAMDYPFINPPGKDRFVWLPAVIPETPAAPEIQNEDELANG